MAGPIVADAVAQFSVTAGTTRPYVLGDLLPGKFAVSAYFGDGDYGYFAVQDSIRHEHIRAQFVAPNQLAVLEILSSSNGGAAVPWPTPGRRIITLENAAAGYLAGLASDIIAPPYRFEEPLTGATITMLAGERELQLDPAASIEALSIILPPDPKDDGLIVTISSSQTILAITVTGDGADEVNGGTGRMAANSTPIVALPLR